MGAWSTCRVRRAACGCRSSLDLTDVPTAEYFGAMATLLRQHGRKLQAWRMDLPIAATAVRHGFFLVTRNIDDFADLEPALTVVGLSDPQ